MEGVDITQRMINIHTIFVLTVCILFGRMNMLTGSFAVGLSIAVCGIIVSGLVFLLKSRLTLQTK